MLVDLINYVALGRSHKTCVMSKNHKQIMLNLEDLTEL